RCSEFVIFWLDLASPSDPPISRGVIHERGLNRTPALITRPSEEPSNAQSEHVQDRIGARLRTGGSNAKTEHDVSRAFLPGKVLTFYLHRKAPFRPNADPSPSCGDKFPTNSISSASVWRAASGARRPVSCVGESSRGSNTRTFLPSGSSG